MLGGIASEDECSDVYRLRTASITPAARLIRGRSGCLVQRFVSPALATIYSEAIQFIPTNDHINTIQDKVSSNEVYLTLY